MTVLKAIARKLPGLSALVESRDNALSELNVKLRGGETIIREINDAAALLPAATGQFRDLKPSSRFGLAELGEIYRPTKRAHNYLVHYDHVFGPHREKVRRMVEIGVQSDKSVRMWRDYFPNAEIIGIDIDPECKAFEGERLKIVIGDQTDRQFLRKFASDYFGQIDIIVDDGLHSTEAIQTSFQNLYPSLSTHGIYAIEDLVGHDFVPALAAEITRGINHWPEGYPGGRWQILDDLGPGASWFAKNTAGMEFYRYLLFVKRGQNPADNPFIMDKTWFFEAQNTGLREVAAAAAALRESGKPITEEHLLEIIGFQNRHFVRDYMSGIESYRMDGTEIRR